MQRTLGPLLLITVLSSCSRTEPTASRESESAPAAAARAPYALSYRAADGATEEPIRSAQDAVRRAPTDASEYARLARAFLQRRRETARPILFAYARDALNAAYALAPRDPDVVVLQVLTRMDAHEFPEARDLAQRLIRLSPADSTGHLLLGDAHLELGQYDAAIDAYQQGMDMLPDLRAYARASHVRWLHGDWEGAVEMMESALQSASRHQPEPAAWCYADLGQMLLARGDAHAALRAARAADALVDDYLPAVVLRGKALGRLGRTDEALAALESAARRQPTAETLLALSEQREHLGDRLGARRELERAFALAGHAPLALSLHLARRDESPDRALALAEAAIAERKNVFSYDAYALALLRTGRVDEATDAIARAHALGTPDARFHLHRGLIEVASGHLDAARTSLSTAMSIDPTADLLVAGELARKLEVSL